MTRKRGGNARTPAEIQQGIASGRLVANETFVRDARTKTAVAIIPSEKVPSGNVPIVFVHIENNVVNLADVKEILRSIAQSQQDSIYHDLQEKFLGVKTVLDLYCSYGENIIDVHRICTDASVVFGSKVGNILRSINASQVEEMDLTPLFGALDAFIDIIFSNIVASYIVFKDRFVNDRAILNCLSSLEADVRRVYEQTLVVSGKSDNNELVLHSGSLSYSLYSMYLFHDQYNIGDLEEIVKHDSRFDTVSQVLSLFKIQLKKGQLRRAVRGHGYGSSDGEVSITVDTTEIPVHSKRNQLMNKLKQILDDINKLQKHRRDIIGMKPEESAVVLAALDFRKSN